MHEDQRTYRTTAESISYHIKKKIPFKKVEKSNSIHMFDELTARLKIVVLCKKCNSEFIVKLWCNSKHFGIDDFLKLIFSKRSMLMDEFCFLPLNSRQRLVKV